MIVVNTDSVNVSRSDEGEWSKSVGERTLFASEQEIEPSEGLNCVEESLTRAGKVASKGDIYRLFKKNRGFMMLQLDFS